MLRNIAKETGGKYFRAENNRKLQAIFKEIDKLEKTKIAVQEFMKKTEMFYPFAVLALILFVMEVILRYTVFRNLP